MQDKNQANVKYILTTLSLYLNVRGMRGLARYLGEAESKIYAWIRNGNIGDCGCILAKNPEINIEWLRTGNGDMVTHGKSQVSAGNKVVMTIEPGPARKDHISVKTTETPLEEQSDGLNEEEAIEQTRYVLRSNTVYRGALVSNIRAFYQGVKREEEMLDVDMTMMSMQEQLDRQEKTMNRMEKLLEKFLGEGTTKEKIQVGGEK